MALLWKMICNLGDPMSLCHPVLASTAGYASLQACVAEYMIFTVHACLLICAFTCISMCIHMYYHSQQVTPLCRRVTLHTHMWVYRYMHSHTYQCDITCIHSRLRLSINLCVYVCACVRVCVCVCACVCDICMMCV